MTKKCLKCEKDFNVVSKRHMFCSINCSALYRYYKTYRFKQFFKSRKCLNCQKEFINKKNRYCSEECREVRAKLKRQEYYKNHSQHKRKLTKLLDKACETCGKLFQTIRPNKRFCKKTCSSSYRKAKKTRRKLERCRHQKISRQFKKEIYSIYQMCPANMQVDHVIPLNHPDISGLHVPWNLEYLTSKENLKKSNEFDYTKENNSWRQKKS